MRVITAARIHEVEKIRIKFRKPESVRIIRRGKGEDAHLLELISLSNQYGIGVMFGSKENLVIIIKTDMVIHDGTQLFLSTTEKANKRTPKFVIDIDDTMVIQVKEEKVQEIDAYCGEDEDGTQNLMFKSDDTSWNDRYYACWVPCTICKNHITVVQPQETARDTNDAPCELCGSHGDYVLDVTCPICDTRLEIIVGEW